MDSTESIEAHPNPSAMGDGGEPSWNGPFEARVSLTGMNKDDDLRVVLPYSYAESSVGQFLDRLFPEAQEGRHEVESMFDLRANPDLPDIYAVLLAAIDEWRGGLCALSVSAGGTEKLDLADRVSRHIRVSPLQKAMPKDENPPSPPFKKTGLGGFLPADIQTMPMVNLPVLEQPGQALSPEASNYPYLDLRVDQTYRAIEYAIRQGFWQGKEELLEWLQTLTLLYFMDKHEFRLPVSSLMASGQEPMPAAAVLQSKKLIAPSQETGAQATEAFSITEDGRKFIGRLLAETESYIDSYDHFKDTSFEYDTEEVLFGGGHGVDLRVQVFMAEGLDPVRTVFLLRLYDGTLDSFASAWGSTIDDEDFFDGILEPVVNRYHVDEAPLNRIIESGYAYLEEAQERARRLETQRDIAQRVWDKSASGPFY